MKKLYKILSPVLLLAMVSCNHYYYSSTSDDTYQSQPGEDITYQQFYDDLSPYGQWIDYPNYGYGWIPSYPGFRPYYTNGSWAYTDYGWTWVSNYNWGWAPFHYGRWTYDPLYGWIWIPGYEWSPAWVAWRTGGDYYGWAPLGPGMSISVNFGGGIPADYWSFVPQQYINSRQIDNYYVDRRQNGTIINNTIIINNTRVVNRNNIYNSGPSVTDVERNTHQTIRPIGIQQRNKPGGTEVSNSRITMYRPSVKETSPQQNQQFRPRKIADSKEMRDRQQQYQNGNGERPNDHNQQNTLNPVDKAPERENPGVRKTNNPLDNRNQPIQNNGQENNKQNDNNRRDNNANPGNKDNQQNQNNDNTRKFNNPSSDENHLNNDGQSQNNDNTRKDNSPASDEHRMNNDQQNQNNDNTRKFNNPSDQKPVNKNPQNQTNDNTRKFDNSQPDQNSLNKSKQDQNPNKENQQKNLQFNKPAYPNSNNPKPEPPVKVTTPNTNKTNKTTSPANTQQKNNTYQNTQRNSNNQTQQHNQNLLRRELNKTPNNVPSNDGKKQNPVQTQKSDDHIKKG